MQPHGLLNPEFPWPVRVLLVCLLLQAAAGAVQARENTMPHLRQPVSGAWTGKSHPSRPAVAGPPVQPVFERNLGQTDSQVCFLSRGNGALLFLTETEAVLQFGVSRQAVLRMRLRGARAKPSVEGAEPASGRSNYFLGTDQEKWRLDVPQYRKVLYRDVYPGVDLVYHATQHEFEYDFTVHPGSDPGTIFLDFVGAKKLRLNAAGDLILETEAGEVRQNRPVAYQMKDGQRYRVEAGYVIAGRQSAQFKIGDYDPRRPLVIDPVLSYSNYQGGTGLDEAYGIAVDSAGNSYLVGTTESINFPTQAPYQPYLNNSLKNAFVMKLNPQGTAVLYSTYLGGSADDEGLAIAVDGSGSAYVAGYTDSTNFPTSSAYRAVNSGSRDGFVAKLNASGNVLAYSTYLGGSGSDLAFAVAVDAQGSFHVAGSTTSTSFPTASAYQASLRGMRDAFVAKFNPAGSTLLYSTYLGGDADDVSYSISVDAAGSAYVAGITQSENFPTAAALQGAYEGGTDVFVTKLTPAGSALVYSTYLGAGFFEDCFSIAVDASGSAYVAGSTESATFPVTSPYQAQKRAGADIFVTKISPSGKTRVYSTFLGGNGEDRANAIAVDSQGNATITGYTLSSDFPVLEGVQATYGGNQDAFVASLNATGLALLYSTYLGGNDKDTATAVALDTVGNAVVAGTTFSSNFAITAGSPAYRGAGDAFAVRLTGSRAPALFVPIIISSSGINNSFYTSELTLTNRGGQDATVEFNYTQAFGGGGGTVTTTLPAGQQRIVPDAIAYLISLGMPIPSTGNRGGTLLVRFLGLVSPADGAVTIRTTTAVPSGRAGLAYPAVPTTLALTGPSYVPGLRQNATDRANLAIQNAGTASQGSITLRLTVFAGTPGSPSQTTLPDQTLGPGEFSQVTLILQSNGLNLDNGFVRIERISGSAPYYAYGVINDNANSDGSFIPAIPESALTGRAGLALPVIVEGTFTSELVLTNWSTAQKVLRFTYVESVAGSSTASFSLTLNSGQQSIIPNIFQYLRSLGVAGIGPVGPTYVGALFATVDGGDAGGIFVGARTSTAGGGGRFGLFYPAVPYGTASNDSAWLYGLQQNAENRTNLALINTAEEGSSPNVFSIELYNGDTGQKVTTLNTTVNARNWIQLGAVLINASGVTQGYARVTRVAGANPFVTYAVINDGGQPNERSGDGAFIASAP